MTHDTASTNGFDVRRADDRFLTEIGWLTSRHSFSFGPHYDPANTGHGLLIVSNDDVVAPGGGFGAHPHRDMEIVTWVLDGELEHRDSEGNAGVIRPGLAQRMSAGTGITHSEMNHSQDEPVHFVQMWVVPDTNGLPPGYEQQDVSEQLDGGELVLVAAGPGAGAAITINQAAAEMWVGRLRAGSTVDVPTHERVHVFVARGAVELDGVRLAAGDAVRATAAMARRLTAVTDSETIIWATAAR
jgi:redox-sensitive bicupin YhaK (pirin superfamily)